MSYYLGIDIGKSHHVAACSNQEGKLLNEPLRFKNNFQGYQKLSSCLENLDAEFKDIYVGMEATGPYWLALYEQLTTTGFKQVIVLNPLEVKSYRNKGIRGSKTDNIDAQLIADILRFGDYKQSRTPSKKTEHLFQLRELCRLRADLVDTSSSFKLKINSILDRIFPEYSQLFDKNFQASSKAVLQQSFLPEEIAKISVEKLQALLKKASKGQLGKNKALHIKQVSKNSVGTTIGADVSALACRTLLLQVEQLDQQVKALKKEITSRFQSQATKLTTISGISDTTGAQILSEIGDFQRFAHLKDGAEKLVALAGLDPQLKQSGKHKGKVKMSKRGSKYLRRAIRQASFSAVFAKKDPMFKGIYDKQKQRGKHHEVALSHVGRKMLHVIFAILRDNKEYEPHV